MPDPIQHGFFVEEITRRLRRQPRTPREKVIQVDPFAGQPRIRSSGNPDTAQVIVVGEMPGDREAELGEAFVGRSGQLLRAIIAEETDLDPGRDVYYGNVIPYRVDGLVTEAQKVKAGKSGVQYLWEELQALDGRPMLVAGGVALQVLMGEKHISGERGILRRLPDGRPVFPIYHPAHILRADDATRPRLEWILRDDIRKFSAWLRRPKASPLGVIIMTEQDLRKVEAYLIKQPLLFFDFETPGLSAWAEPSGAGRILAAGFSCKPGEAFGIPINCEGGPLDPAAAKAAVGRILASPAEKGALHGQHDLHWAAMAGFEVRNFRWDDMLAATLLADRPYTEIKSNLLRLAADWIGEIEYPWLRVDKSRMAEQDAATVCGVAATDAEWELRIHLALTAALEMRERIA